MLTCADVAQLVEQLIRNEQVIGSNPTISSSEIKASEKSEAFFDALLTILLTTIYPLFIIYGNIIAR